ncbi:MAG: zinc dependent phospholipase C family protein [Acidiferrobacterales bacterium]|nr:zinc dependent phospholipase C family protein [Acidiferrobacterales bacterium]
MNTPAHIVFSLAALGPGRAATYPLAIATGAVLPDLAMMFFYAWHKLIGTAEDMIWSHHYYQESWQGVFDFWNSIPLVAAAMFFFYWRERTALACLFASMLTHCVLDFFVHNDDAHRHFYPFSNWKLQSPISYWDPSHYGDIVGKIEVAAVLVLSIWLWRATRANPLMVDRSARLYSLLVLTNLIYLGFFYYVVQTWA